MNDLFVFVYGLMFAAITGATFAFMWRSMGMVRDEFDKPRKKRKTNIHPEMEDVKSGETLLVFKGLEIEEENEDSKY
tara:strand:+ start:308 stop:538 length:231 start_codon:yes stop_codon:yes gene_type:complete